MGRTRRNRPRWRPPIERFDRPMIKIFLSYTRREKEVAELQPVADFYCQILAEWAYERGVDIFYDRVSISQSRRYSTKELKRILRSNIRDSHLFISFLSPRYIESGWCRFEYMTKVYSEVDRREYIIRMFDFEHFTGRQIHRIYWKPEIIFEYNILSRLVRPFRTKFLSVITRRNNIERSWRDINFTNLAGSGWSWLDIVRCAQTSAKILLREHHSLFSELRGNFDDDAWFAKKLFDARREWLGVRVEL